MRSVGKVLTLNGWSTHYEEAGDGPAVLFVHGGFPNLVTELQREQARTSTWSWELDFARHFRFICYDRRGCHRATAPMDGYDLETQATDIEDLLERLRVASAHFIGSSAGGPIALLFAATRPSRVLSLTLAGTALQLFPEKDPAVGVIKDYRDAVLRLGEAALIDSRPTEAVASFGELWEQAEYAQRNQLQQYLQRQADLRRRAESAPASVRRHFYRIELAATVAYMSMDLRCHAALIQCPSLVIHGEVDRMIPATWGRSLAESVPGTELRILPGGSHGLIHRSEEARGWVVDFIRRVDSGQEQPRGPITNR